MRREENMAAIRVTATPAAIDNQSKVHLIPCKVKVSGEARVNEYFESTIRKVQRKSIDSSGVKQASFQGRPLQGKDIKLPPGYKGLILKEEREPYSEEEDRTLIAKGSFDSFCYWNLENQPTENDNVFQALKWLDIANMLHGNVMPNGEESSPELTQADR